MAQCSVGHSNAVYTGNYYKVVILRTCISLHPITLHVFWVLNTDHSMLTCAYLTCFAGGYGYLRSKSRKDAYISQKPHNSLTSDYVDVVHGSAMAQSAGMRE